MNNLNKNKNKSIIFHIDFDSYFVSAIRTIRPELKNKPVAVGRKNKKFLATSISYELKNKGLKTGMNNYEILKVEPKTIFVEGHFDLYTTLSTKIFNYIIENYSPLISVISIDECYLDVTSRVVSLNQAYKLAQKLQFEILQKFDIPITIGISHNCFFAKMTTNINKPFGIGMTTKENYQKHFFDLPIENFYGIGKSSAQKLKEMGILTIRDLSETKIDTFQFKSILGINYRKWIENLNPNHYDHIIIKEEIPKGIGNEVTFTDYNLTKDQIFAELKKLIQLVTMRCKRKKLIGNVIVLNVRHINKKWQSKQKKISFYTNDYDEIIKIIWYLYNQNFKDQKIIGIGIRINDLIYEFHKEVNLNLFNNNFSNNNNNNEIQSIINLVNRKSNKVAITTLQEFNQFKILENKANKFSLDGFVFKKR